MIKTGWWRLIIDDYPNFKPNDSDLEHIAKCITTIHDTTTGSRLKYTQTQSTTSRASQLKDSKTYFPKERNLVLYITIE